MAPALFACVASNEAERVAPGTTLNDVQMIGATGRVFISGNEADLQTAKSKIDEVLGGIRGLLAQNCVRLGDVVSCDAAPNLRAN